MRAEMVTNYGTVIDITRDGETVDVAMWDTGWCHSATVSLNDTELGELIHALTLMKNARR